MPGISTGLGIDIDETRCRIIDAHVTVLILKNGDKTYAVTCTGARDCGVTVDKGAILSRQHLEAIGCPLLEVPYLEFRDDIKLPGRGDG